MATNKVTASGRWGVLDANRKAHLERARKCSELTLPSLLPPEGADENTPLPTPWQTMGARCVNNLASKIVLTLMPPNAPCMRFVIDQTVIDQLKAQMGDARYAQEVEFALSKQEWEVQKWMEKSRIRAPSFRIMRLLISTGNALMFRTPKGGLKVYRLDQYVVRRNGQGEPVEIVVKEPISPENVPDSCRLGETKEDTTGKHDMLSLYTYCRKHGDEWQVWQEINDKVVPKSKGKFTDEDSFPFRPLVWSLSDGEDYGRGHVEEHLGDFISLEELTKAVVESTAAGAKLLFMINPNGVTRKRDLIETPNGGFCMGVMDDVGILRVEKMNDLSVAANQIDKLEKNLSMAFLLHASIQRSGERVTAEEIRWMAQDIEDGLGGIYSLLAQQYQLPLVQWALAAMEKEGKMQKLPEEVSVTITTGLEALGRGHDLNKLNQFMQQMSIVPEDELRNYLEFAEYIKRVATALSIDTQGLVRTMEEVQDRLQQQQQQVQQQRVADMATNSGVAKEAVKGMVNQQTQG